MPPPPPLIPPTTRKRSATQSHTHNPHSRLHTHSSSIVTNLQSLWSGRPSSRKGRDAAASGSGSTPTAEGRVGDADREGVGGAGVSDEAEVSLTLEELVERLSPPNTPSSSLARAIVRCLTLPNNRAKMRRMSFGKVLGVLGNLFGNFPVTPGPSTSNGQLGLVNAGMEVIVLFLRSNSYAQNDTVTEVGLGTGGGEMEDMPSAIERYALFDLVRSVPLSSSTSTSGSTSEMGLRLAAIRAICFSPSPSSSTSSENELEMKIPGTEAEVVRYLLGVMSGFLDGAGGVDVLEACAELVESILSASSLAAGDLGREVENWFVRRIEEVADRCVRSGGGNGGNGDGREGVEWKFPPSANASTNDTPMPTPTTSPPVSGFRSPPYTHTQRTASYSSKTHMYAHKRHGSSGSLFANAAASASASMLDFHSTPVTTPAIAPPAAVHMQPTATTILKTLSTLYLAHLSLSRSPTVRLAECEIGQVFPTLFLVMGTLYMDPLPRLTVSNSRKGTGPGVGVGGKAERGVENVLRNACEGVFGEEAGRVLKSCLEPAASLPSSSDEASRSRSRTKALTALGALRTLRLALRTRTKRALLRAYVSDLATNYTQSGGIVLDDSQVELMGFVLGRGSDDEDADGPEVMEREGEGWDAGFCEGWLAECIERWIADFQTLSTSSEGVVLEEAKEDVEKIVGEVLGILKDLLLEVNGEDVHSAADVGGVYDMKGLVVSEVLGKAVKYVESVRNPDGTPYRLPLERPREAPSTLLQAFSDFLDPAAGQASSSPIPHLPLIALSIAPHLEDHHTSRIPYDLPLTPISSTWLDDWKLLFERLCKRDRPVTRESLFRRAGEVYELVRDWGVWRRPLGELVWLHWKDVVDEEKETVGADVVIGAEEGVEGVREGVWRVLGREVVARIYEDGDGDEGEEKLEEQILVFMRDVAMTCACEGLDDAAGMSASTYTQNLSPTPPLLTSPFPQASGSASTSASGTPRPGSGMGDNKRDSVPGLVSHILLGSRIVEGVVVDSSNSKVPTQTPPETPVKPRTSSFSPPSAEVASLATVPESSHPCQGCAAIVALINVFSQVAWSPESRPDVAERLFVMLLKVLTESPCNKTRIVVLQFLLRLRSDRDHRVYLQGDIDHDVEPLAERLDFTQREAHDIFVDSSSGIGGPRLSRSVSAIHAQGQGQRSRAASRGFGTRPGSSGSRSRSRAPKSTPATHPAPKYRTPLWGSPETIAFAIPERDTDDDILFIQPSALMVTYLTTDLPPGPTRCLLVSDYVDTLVNILETETDWDVLAYVLTHLPLQLANKHFFCGPLSREAILRLLETLCRGLADETLASNAEHIPGRLKARDARCVGYHTLTVLVSYRSMFESSQCDQIVRVFQQGLMAGIPTTLICCISGLALCAYEFEDQLSRHLPQILERMEMIMSNAEIAVHILSFLSAVGSIPSLYANFTDQHYTTVFAIALKYLETHNDPDANSNLSFALTQHVLVMTFNIIYTWFLALNLEDRPKHVSYITRRVLNANKNVLNEPAEVCFDWLARYTYASVDPKPAHSVLRDAVMKGSSTADATEGESSGERWLLLGTTIVVMRAHAKRGWIEVESRRTSGMTRFLCRVENLPQVPVGDVNPDLISLPAAAMMNRVPRRMKSPATRLKELESELETSLKEGSEEAGIPVASQSVLDILKAPEEALEKAPLPDATTGYVWENVAPSQRRKEVSALPSFFGIQLSPYPDDSGPDERRSINITSLKGLNTSIRNLDLVPVIDTHNVGVLYVAPRQTELVKILSNEHGSPAYTRFLENLGRLVRIRGQQDVYVGGLNPDVDGEYAIAWWDDIGQVLFHVTTLMPNTSADGEPTITNKQSHVGNDLVKVIWNDSGLQYDFHMVPGQFNFVNIIIEPHSTGTIAAYSDDLHENEYFKVNMQRREGMPDFGPIREFKIISASKLPLFIRRVSFLADWFCKVYERTTTNDTNEEFITNWRYRLQRIKQIKERAVALAESQPKLSLAESFDFTTLY